MATFDTRLQARLSGGASNANPQNSLGGVMSSEQVKIDWFDGTTFPEAADGRIEYRTGYAYNSGASTARNAVAYISPNTPNAGTTLALGLGTSGMNGTEQVMASEGAVPPGVTFVVASSPETGVALGDIPSGQKRGFVIRRTVNPGTSAASADSATVILAWSYEQ